MHFLVQVLGVEKLVLDSRKYETHGNLIAAYLEAYCLIKIEIRKDLKSTDPSATISHAKVPLAMSKEPFYLAPVKNRKEFESNRE